MDIVCIVMFVSVTCSLATEPVILLCSVELSSLFNSFFVYFVENDQSFLCRSICYGQSVLEHANIYGQSICYIYL
jgi:hypothetical protein